jgi:hypothetical protein
MLARILPFAVAAAWLSAAIPAHAYDPSDPAGPPADDPAAYSSLPAPRRIAQDLKACAMMVAHDASAVSADDPSAAQAAKAADCSCALKTCSQHHSAAAAAEPVG